MKISLSELDVIFISYDEPNADENWADLQNKCPWAKRSHGVYGSDAAHKAAAQLSDTDRFIGIDGDNIIDPKIFNLEYDESIINSERVLSFKGINIVNGLIYGNGGIKCWPVKTVMEMKTHEISETDKGQIEFCWDLQYLQTDKVFSTVYNNASPYQAFRAGFREGCKMSLEQGAKVEGNLFEKIYPVNKQRLLTWMSVGADSENGLWCIYGARLGFVMTNLRDWDYINVRDFEWITALWKETIAPLYAGKTILCPRTGYSWNNLELSCACTELGVEIEKEYGIYIPRFNKHESKFIKEIL